MKFSLMLVTLLMCQLTFAQSIKEKKVKKEMLDRTDTLIEKIEEARDDLDKEDAITACIKIKEIFALYPDHLVGIGTHLDIDRVRTIKARDRALHELIDVHRLSLLCSSGKDAENVDPKEVRKELRKIEKSLKKQRRIIKKTDTDNENSFSYEYEFHN